VIDFDSNIGVVFSDDLLVCIVIGNGGGLDLTLVFCFGLHEIDTVELGLRPLLLVPPDSASVDCADVDGVSYTHE